jgi:hypothetical protein
MLYWDIYEISSLKHALVGVKCRGRIRKYALENDIDLLAENASDVRGRVRFAILTGTDPQLIEEHIRTFFDDAMIHKVAAKVPNPVLSKLHINITERYESL